MCVWLDGVGQVGEEKKMSHQSVQANRVMFTAETEATRVMGSAVGVLQPSLLVQCACVHPGWER